MLGLIDGSWLEEEDAHGSRQRALEGDPDSEACPSTDRLLQGGMKNEPQGQIDRRLPGPHGTPASSMLVRCCEGQFGSVEHCSSPTKNDAL